MIKELAEVKLCDPSAERSVLGTMLAFPEQIPVVRGLLREEDFYYEEHRLLFKLLLKLWDERGMKWDEVVLRDYLTKEGLEDRLPYEWILEVYEEATPVPLLESACRIVREKSLQRHTFEVITKKALPELKRGDLDLPSLISELTGVLAKLSILESRTALEVANDLLSRVERGQREVFYSTGYPSLEAILDGISLPTYMLIGARPRVGKTTFALNLAFNLHRIGQATPPPVLFVSLEMTEEGLMKKLLSLLSGVPFSKLRNENLTEEERERVASAVFSNLERFENFYIYRKPALDLHELEGQIVKHHMEKGVEVVIIDYIQLLRYRGQLGLSYEALSSISQHLYAISQKYNLLLIGLLQLSREAEKRGDKRPSITDAKGSGQFEQDADVMILLHREGLYMKKPKEEDLRKLEVIVAKNRMGRSGVAVLDFDLATQRISDAGGVQLDVHPSEPEPEEDSHENDDEDFDF